MILLTRVWIGLIALLKSLKRALQMLTEGIRAMIKTHVDQTVCIETSLKSLVSFFSTKTIVCFLLVA